MKKKSAENPLLTQTALLRTGRTPEAITAVEKLASEGDTLANAVLSQIAAFEGDWLRVLSHTAKFLSAPSAARSANVLVEQFGYLRIAAQETKKWQDAIAALPAPATPVLVMQVRNFYEAAKQAGAVSEVPVLVHPNDGNAKPPVRSEEERRELFEKAVATAKKEKRFKGKPPEVLARHCFALAVGFGMEQQMLELFRETPSLFLFSHALDVAPLMVRKGEREQAWEALYSRLWSWFEEDAVQIAPARILLEDTLRSLWTPERGALVLAAPRGIAVHNQRSSAV